MKHLLQEEFEIDATQWVCNNTYPRVIRQARVAPKLPSVKLIFLFHLALNYNTGVL